MIMLSDDGLWLGSAACAYGDNLAKNSIGAVLNVAQDLRGQCGWPEFEYVQVGLVDGIGNLSSTYASAVLALHYLLGRHKTVVCCHGGSRSLAVCIMYLEITRWLGPTVPAARHWETWLEILNERTNIDLMVPHEVHAQMYKRMNWRSLARVVENKL